MQDGRLNYCVSDRDGRKGKRDIFSFGGEDFLQIAGHLAGMS